MATAKVTKNVPAKVPPRSIAGANYEERLAAMAAESAQSEANVGGGSFISVKSGQLTYGGNTIKGNELDVVVLTSIHENCYYDDRYDPDNPQTPLCYAFGNDDDNMAPHPESAAPQNGQCGIAGRSGCCPNNEFGTADNGKGKACKNIRRLSLLPGDQLDSETVESTNTAYFKVPVTSVKGWASFVKTVATLDKLPPLGVVCRIGVMPDPKSQFKVTFQKVGMVPRELLGTLMERAETEKEAIKFPYAKPSEEATAPKGKAGAKKAPTRKAKF